MISIGILGAKGRMGKEVSQCLEHFKSQARLTASVGRGEPTSGLMSCAAVIDFSSPDAAIAFAESNTQAKLPVWICGTTGWTVDQKKKFKSLMERAPLMLCSNFSLGMLAFEEILKAAAPLLEKLKYTPVVNETHHRHKKDIPSGTAISLQRIIAPAGPGNVQTHSVRAGEIIGEHEVAFFGDADVIRIQHSAKDRSIFARGAIEAALWLAEKREKSPDLKGLFKIEDFFKEKFVP